jgi:hypothetical protein
MIAAIVGCGGSADNWLDHMADYLPIERNILTYGVNDAAKWGWGFDKLIVVNGPNQFTSERLNTISATTTGEFLTHAPKAWEGYFPNATLLTLREFHGHRLQHGFIYKSKTSPFVAMSLAVDDGAKEINLFGVDFNDHKIYRRGTKAGDHEMSKYARYAELLDQAGVKVRVTKESALSKFMDTI